MASMKSFCILKSWPFRTRHSSSSSPPITMEIVPDVSKSMSCLSRQSRGKRFFILKDHDVALNPLIPPIVPSSPILSHTSIWRRIASLSLSAGITVDFQFLSLLTPQIIPSAKMIAKMRGTPTASNSNVRWANAHIRKINIISSFIAHYWLIIKSITIRCFIFAIKNV